MPPRSRFWLWLGSDLTLKVVVGKQEGVPVYCDECACQVGFVKAGCVVLFSRHHGEKHETQIKYEGKKEEGKNHD